jgi:hypothetical protein
VASVNSDKNHTAAVYTISAQVEKGDGGVILRPQYFYLTLKQETSRPPGNNLLLQQARFDDFIEGHNKDRPHQALGGQYPGEVYTPSPREYHRPEVPAYPFHDRTIRVTQRGRICIGHRKINFSTALTGQYVCIREVTDQIGHVNFMDYDLGFFDKDVNRVERVG